MSVLDRFEKKVNKFGSSGCWIWLACRNREGYGTFSLHGVQLAHRVAWQLYKGPIPNDPTYNKGPYRSTPSNVLHNCDNPSCVNPEHLFLGTHAENILDSVIKKRWNRPTGENCHLAKLTSEIVREIRCQKKLSEESHYAFSTRLALKYGTSRHCIHSILMKETWNEPKPPSPPEPPGDSSVQK